MTAPDSKFVLPGSIERHLAALAKLYAKEQETRKQEIVVNAEVRVHEEWDYDNWNGGIHGHALYLTLPEDLYLSIVRDRDQLQREIGADLNKIHNEQHEHISTVFIELAADENSDWRRDSGVLRARRQHAPEGATQRIWGEARFRVFLSHKTEVKQEAASLKQCLQMYGIGAFVAHQDIHPTTEWQDEIESALRTMDCFVALLTAEFHDSLWTDQEVGFALCRGVPMIAVRLGKDPYGFIGKFQALSCGWNDVPRGIVGLLIQDSAVIEAYLKAVSECSSFDTGNELAKILPMLTKLSPEQANQLVDAYNTNSQLRGSYGFDGRWPTRFGDGLGAHLFRITGQRYQTSDHRIWTDE